MIQVVLESGEPIHGLEIRPVLTDNGQTVRPWLLVSIEPLSIDSGRHVVVALDDITNRKRAEEELRDAVDIKSQFISTVSHELRTPMTSIREAAIILLDEVAGKINKDQRHFLDIAKRNIERLSRLIDSVLDFQKLEAGKMRYDIRKNDLQKTVEDACNTMRPYAQKRGVHLHVEYEPNLPAVAFDTDRLIQVVTNLVSNAIKFTPEGGRIAVSVQSRSEHIAIRVSDTGLGIPKEALPKVFERFYRVKRPGKEIKGTGLGLAIVNKIVNAHGGRIDVESKLNKGTTFTVLLPYLVKPDSDVLPEQTDEHLERTLAND
jgi:signal transduction histidine kinase